jgi:hypothetical protein
MVTDIKSMADVHVSLATSAGGSLYVGFVMLAIIKASLFPRP